MINRKKAVLVSILAVSILLSFSIFAHARSGYKSTFNSLYGTAGTRLDVCELCHGSTKSIRNAYGLDVEAELNGGANITDALINVEANDSDGDGYSNIDEIGALTFPGDANDSPSGPSCTDADNDGYAVEGGSCGPVDCNDNDPQMNPGLAEDCADAKDNDCDGLIDSEDPDCGPPPTCTDADGDGYAVEGGTCGEVDCNDSDPDINPGACDIKSNGIDEDCSGSDRIHGKACPGSGGGDTGGTEGKGKTCSDSVDNDGDGLIDCADPDCANNKSCK